MKTLTTYKDSRNHNYQFTLENLTFSVEQNKIDKRWRTFLNGKLITDHGFDVMSKRDGSRLALKKAKDIDANYYS